MRAREAPEFKDYFNQIWKELGRSCIIKKYYICSAITIFKKGKKRKVLVCSTQIFLLIAFCHMGNSCTM